MRISDWSSDVCSSDLPALRRAHRAGLHPRRRHLAPPGQPAAAPEAVRQPRPRALRPGLPGQPGLTQAPAQDRATAIAFPGTSGPFARAVAGLTSAPVPIDATET